MQSYSGIGNINNDKDDHNNVNHFNFIPKDILLEIFLKLDPKSARVAAAVNTLFRQMSNVYWHKRFKKHFEYLYNLIPNKQRIIWSLKFAEVASLKYIKFEPIEIKTFELIKDGDISALEQALAKKEIIIYDGTHDNNVFNLKESVIDKNENSQQYYLMDYIKEQKMFDFLYNHIKQSYLTSTGKLNSKKRDYKSITIFYWAVCLRQSTKELQFLLDSGCDVNAQTIAGLSPLHAAIKNNDVAAIKLLLEKGANVNLTDKAGRTPLHFAINCGKEVIQLLNDKGTNIDAIDKDKFTPLMYAAQYGNAELARTLLEIGTDVNKATPLDETALSIAARYGHVEVVKVLLEFGANMTPSKSDSVSPLFIATQHGHTQVIKLLSDQAHNSKSVFQYKANLFSFSGFTYNKKTTGADAAKKMHNIGTVIQTKLLSHKKNETLLQYPKLFDAINIQDWDEVINVLDLIKNRLTKKELEVLLPIRKSIKHNFFNFLIKNLTDQSLSDDNRHKIISRILDVKAENNALGQLIATSNNRFKLYFASDTTRKNENKKLSGGMKELNEIYQLFIRLEENKQCEDMQPSKKELTR